MHMCMEENCSKEMRVAARQRLLTLINNRKRTGKSNEYINYRIRRVGCGYGRKRCRTCSNPTKKDKHAIRHDYDD